MSFYGIFGVILGFIVSKEGNYPILRKSSDSERACTT
jgi:hypothetical protein